MKKVLLIGLLIAAVTLISAPAFAFDLGGYLGPVSLKFAGYTRSLSNDAGIPGETWGVVKLTAVENPFTLTNLWAAGQNNEQIYGIIYGLTDHSVVGESPNVTINQMGGHFALYMSSTPGHAGEFDLTNPAARRLAVDQYDSVTNIPGSVLFLSGDFAPGIVNGDFVTTIQQNVTAATTPTTGSGHGYGDLVNGGFLSLFNSDALVDANGNKHDLLFDFTVKDNVAGRPLPTGWHTFINDPVTANAVPEPASMLLFGTGLFGLVGAKLRKKVA